MRSLNDSHNVAAVPPFGVLGFGSLLIEPGHELERCIDRRVDVMTPFPIEYGRYSTKTRGGAPTVVRHPRGGPVAAQVLVLKPHLDLTEASDMLWRRETRSAAGMRPSATTSVLVQQVRDVGGCSVVLYTDFRSGRIETPSVLELAEAAIKSVRDASTGKDGITYLDDLIAQGIITPLTYAYRDEILRLTRSATLKDARARLLSESKPS